MTDRAQRGPVLITGAGGFVGRHLIAHLLEQDDGPLVGLIRGDGESHGLPSEVSLVQGDLTDSVGIRAVVQATAPRLVYHLAALSSVAESHSDPLGTLFNNIAAQVNLLEALSQRADQARVLVVGSNEEYGDVRPEDVPVRETTELRPLSPYAVSKVAQDLLGFQYYKARGLPVVRVRPFTHTGPGQEPRFVTPAFARQIARIETGLQAPVLSVGNLAAQRDISDVRDIVRGYRLALLHGEAGEVYNLGSERAVSIRSVLDQLLAMSTASIQVRVDPTRFRPSESTPQFCDAGKLRTRTGWRPLIPLKQTLADVLADWRERVARGGDAC